MTKPSPSARGDGSPRKRKKARRYTDADKAKALDVLRSDGLTAAAKATGAGKASVLRWARTAGINPADYANRSTEQNKQAAAAAVAARRRATAERRTALSDLLITELGPTAAGMLLKRLAEELRFDELIAADEERLEDAITSLKVLTEAASDTELDQAADKVKERKVMRDDARQAVRDCLLILTAHRRGRSSIPELVGVLTRAVTDHLNLEQGDANIDGGPGITVVLTSNRPVRQRPPVVTLDPEPAAR